LLELAVPVFVPFVAGRDDFVGRKKAQKTQKQGRLFLRLLRLFAAIPIWRLLVAALSRRAIDPG